MSVANPHAVGGTSAFALPLDNLLNLSPQEIKIFLALMALLYDSAVVSDSWVNTNAGLIAVLRDSPDGQEYLRQGMLRIALRDSRGSFREVFQEFRDANIHGLSADEAFADFLDTHARGRMITFPRARVGQNYKAMMEQVLNRDFLMRVGVSPEAAEIAMRVIGAAKADGTYKDSNTFVKNDVLIHVASPDDQQLIMDTARAPYSLNLPKLLGMGVQGPDNYTGDRVLRLMNDSVSTGSVTVTADRPLTVDDAFNDVIGDATVRWLFAPATLGQLTAEDLVAARTAHDSDRQEYLVALESFLGTPSSVTWELLVFHMRTYFKKAALVVLDRWAASGRLTGEPIGTPVQIDGSSSGLKLLTDVPLQVSAVDLGSAQASGSIDISVPDAVQLIGRRLAMPAAPAESTV